MSRLKLQEDFPRIEHPIQQVFDDVARLAGAPPAIAAQVVLGAMAIAAQEGYKLDYTKGVMTPALSIGVLAESGDGKGNAFRAVSAALDKAEDRLLEDQKREIRKYKQALEDYNDAKKAGPKPKVEIKTRTGVVQNDDDQQEARPQKPEKPPWLELENDSLISATDTNDSGLIDRLCVFNRFAIVNSEGGTQINNWSGSSKQKSGQFQALLTQLWSGEKPKVLRTAGGVTVKAIKDQPAVTTLIATQVRKGKEFYFSEAAKENGMCARALVSMRENPWTPEGGRVTIAERNDLEARIGANLGRFVVGLFPKTMAARTAERLTVRLTREAEDLAWGMTDIMSDTARAEREAGDMAMSGVYMRTVENVGRIALILALYREYRTGSGEVKPDGTTAVKVDLDDINHAFTIVRWFNEESRRILNVSGTTAVSEEVERILNTAHKWRKSSNYKTHKGVGYIQLSRWKHCNKAMYKKDWLAEKAMKQLIDQGYIERTKVGNTEVIAFTQELEREIQERNPDNYGDPYIQMSEQEDAELALEQANAQAME